MRGVATGVLAGALLALAAIAPPTRAEPDAGDLVHAKDLYKSAEAAMTDGRFSDAIRDYGAAYEITKDPVLFYKIGTANERLGKCEVALIYYRRYLKEGQPTEQFVKKTHERIAACGGSIIPPVRPTLGDGSGSDHAETGSAAAPEPEPQPQPQPPDAGSGSAAAGSAATAAPPVLGKNRAPWLLVGGSIAFGTLGAVLAYSANAAERDIDDLYVGLMGTPPAFDPRTKQRYDDAIAEGERYQTLSLISFGVAGAMAIGAAVLFAIDRDRVQVAPTASRDGAGVSATVRF
jgi:hypothetical protein